MEAYEGSVRKPKIEVTENAFKITIPNRNISNASDEETEDQKESVEQEKRVMKLAKENGSVSRKEIEGVLGISQSTGGRLLKKNGCRRTDCSNWKRKKYTLCASELK